jgi:hypothetical protein
MLVGFFIIIEILRGIVCKNRRSKKMSIFLQNRNLRLILGPIRYKQRVQCGFSEGIH